MKYRINVTVKKYYERSSINGAFGELLRQIDIYEDEGYKLTEALYGEYLLTKDNKESVILTIQKESDETNN